jgi:hypothetical protein
MTNLFVLPANVTSVTQNVPSASLSHFLELQRPRTVHVFRSRNVVSRTIALILLASSRETIHIVGVGEGDTRATFSDMCIGCKAVISRLAARTH